MATQTLNGGTGLSHAAASLSGCDEGGKALGRIDGESKAWSAKKPEKERNQIMRPVHWRPLNNFPPSPPCLLPHITALARAGACNGTMHEDTIASDSSL